MSSWAWAWASAARWSEASRTMPWPARANDCEPLAAKRFFIKADIPVPVELASLLGEVGHPFEAKSLVQRYRRLVGQCDPGIGSVHVLTLQLLEQLFVQARPDAAPNGVGSDIDARFDRCLISGLRPPAAAACITDDGAVREPNHDPVAASGAVVLEPFAARLERHRFDIEREVGLDHIPVVDVVELSEVLLARVPHRDLAAAQLHERFLRFTSKSVFRAPGRVGAASRARELPGGPDRSRGNVVQRPPRSAARRARADTGVQGHRRARGGPGRTRPYRPAGRYCRLHQSACRRETSDRRRACEAARDPRSPHRGWRTGPTERGCRYRQGCQKAAEHGAHRWGGRAH